MIKTRQSKLASASKANSPAQTICQLNDAFRQSFVGGQVVVTSSIGHLSDKDRFALFALVQNFNDFTPDNDPHGEHDFGSFKLKGDTYYWKIDYYDLDWLGHSPDATDTSVTNRVLTILQAEEY